MTKKEREVHFISYINPNNSPFDNLSEYITKCSNCGCGLSNVAFYCPICGVKIKERVVHARDNSIIIYPSWIPVSKRLPEDLEPVIITWVNHNPESYYADIKDKPFTATGVYFNGQWYWWSTLCTDILAEYSHNYDDIIDDDIEITAWMPLPGAYSEVEE